MDNKLRKQYNELLEGISKALDIPPSKYQLAVQRYTAVGNWLKEGAYENSVEEPSIYPQGSFRLGTVVRPIKDGKEVDYDIDLVCQLGVDKTLTSPKEIKTLVGKRLKENETYLKMLDDEKPRCWTLNYAEQDGIGFHIDILPSTPEDKMTKEKLIEFGIPSEMAKKAIAISDKESDGDYSWSSSNPSGYAMWFDLINKPMFLITENQAKKFLFENNRAVFNSIEEVPDQLVKTPLQRAIQILKRHRDLRFAGHEWEADKPISMIITTLSAKLYQNEADVYSALKNILEKLNVHAQLLNPNYLLSEEYSSLQLITKKPDGTWFIPNPVNPDENFADKWHENDDRKARAFFLWVAWVYTDLIEIIENTDFPRTKKLLSHRFGEQLIEKASNTILVAAPTSSILLSSNAPSVTIKTPSKPWGNQ